MAARNIDWEDIERDYRAGVLSVRKIAEKHGVSHVAIGKRADKEGWTRDLQAKIKAKADELVSKQAVTKSVTAETKASDQAVVEANAEMIAERVFAQRRDVTRYRGLINKLADQLELQLDDPELFDRLAELMSQGAEEGAVDKLNDAYRKVISLPSKIDSAKKLADTLKTLIELERRVLKLDEEDDTKGSGSVEDFLSKIGAS